MRCYKRGFKAFVGNKPIGASPGRDYVLTRMVLQIIQYDILHSVRNDKSKKGGDTPRATD